MALVTVDKDQIDAVNAAVSKLTTDVTAGLTNLGTELATGLADLAAKITAAQGSPTVDPATATELGGILTSLGALDSSTALSIGTLVGDVQGADPGPVAATPATPPAAN